MKNKLSFEMTNSSIAYQVLFDFVDSLDARLRELKMSRKDFSNKLNITEGRVSQVFNDPANFTMRKIAEMARALGMKIALVSYVDAEDPSGAPVFSSNFRRSWETLGRPKNEEDLERLEKACTDCSKKWIAQNVVWGDFQHRPDEWGKDGGSEEELDLPNVQVGG
jgi:transcriptional regulator with XRE-family HTH domain